MKYSYAIFDMDGLMFDTENLFVTSFETEVSRATGYRFEREQLKNLLGRFRFPKLRQAQKAHRRKRQQNAGAVSAAVSGLPRQL